MYSVLHQQLNRLFLRNQTFSYIRIETDNEVPDAYKYSEHNETKSNNKIFHEELPTPF